MKTGPGRFVSPAAACLFRAAPLPHSGRALFARGAGSGLDASDRPARHLALAMRRAGRNGLLPLPAEVQ